ncbi:hypothetical protein GIB67_014644 [Kingdonia uniflora]|uniref:Uncharacterized protein n=1 Tax=Kingdonia uniflora TaxID=39325 RepID=A0A7J7LY07_9MAGN|nr:hypothetical protein GIB67_014644 [Kingdonia uniflora]
MMKNRAKSLLCFVPVSMEKPKKPESKKKCSKDQIFTNYISYKSKEDLMKSESPGKKKSAKKVLARVVKAVFFEAFLMKKDSKSKVHRCDSFDDVEKVSYVKPNQKVTKCDDSLISASVSRSSCLNSNSSSLILSSTTSSARTSSAASIFESNSSPTPRLLPPDGKKTFRSFKSSRSNSYSFESKLNSDQSFGSGELRQSQVTSISTTGVCFFLLTLMVLVFWGRFFAILVTSTWLYFICRRQISEFIKPVQVKLQKETQLVVIDRKKVIMEGFLQRDHSKTIRV